MAKTFRQRRSYGFVASMDYVDKVAPVDIYIDPSMKRQAPEDTPGSPNGAGVPLSAKVALLSRRESYPDPTVMVEVKETHMSWVFLTDTYVYKLKKPVRTEFLDFSTLEARRINCEREVQLNLRLAPAVYLGLAPITIDARGQLSLNGTGEPVDWLVKMQRLPASRNLENLIASRDVRESDIRHLARFLATFYAVTPAIPMDAGRYRDSFAAGIHENSAELMQPIYGVPPVLIKDIATSLSAHLARHGSALEGRAVRVVEGHGDLRPEHVYLTNRPVVLDCLEFNLALRLLDPVNELAYLAMECDRLGAPFIENWLFDVYCTRLDDHPTGEIVSFYKSCNALLRAKIAIKHLDEPQVREPTKWTDRANQYLRLARRYLELAE